MAYAWRTGPLFLAALGLLVASCRAVPARGGITVQSEEDRLILESFLKHAAAAPARFTPESVAKIEQVEDICWTWAPQARVPLAAYQLTGDRQHLDGFVKVMDGLLTRLRKGPDGYLGFRGLPLPLFRNKENPATEIEVDIAEFEIAHLICDFVEAVDADDALKRAYAEKRAHYLEVAEKHLAGPKWEQRGLYQDLGAKGAIFRMPPECGNDRDSLTNPHNKQSKMCRTYLALYRVTGNDDTFRKAIRLGTRLKRTLVLDGDRYRWNYWDPAGDWDRKPGSATGWKHWVGPEHRGGYHSLTIAMAEALYDHGVLFDRTDMQRFLNTQMQVCWNGSLDSPEFRNTGGQPIREAAHGTVMASSLARFEPKVWQFCYGERATRDRLSKREHSWSGGVQAVGYLLGKHLAPRSAEPAHADYGERFHRKPANAAFLKELAFTVPAGE